MLNKFKNLLHEYLDSRKENKIDEALEFRNRSVVICGNSYFLGKGMITDIPDILRLDEAAYGQKMEWTKRRFKEELKNKKNRFYLILRKHDELFGFICISINRKAKTCQIENFAILPKVQKQGLGYFLITTIIERAREMHLNTVICKCHTGQINMQDLLKDLGFVQEGIEKQYFYNNDDAVVLMLHLNKKNYMAADNFGR